MVGVCFLFLFISVYADQYTQKLPETDLDVVLLQELERAVQALDLTLYIGSGCPYCRKVMQFVRTHKLESFITIKDVWANKNDLQELTTMTGGKRTVPCLKLDNTSRNYMHGSDGIIQTLGRLLVS